MGYTLPLRFIKVSNKRNDTKQFDVAICATRIVAMMSTDIYQARRSITDQKKAGTLINAAGVNAAKTAIILDNGAIVSSPLTVPVLMNAIAKSNDKGVRRTNPRMKTYEVYDNEPKEDDEYIEELSATDEDDDYDDYDS